MELTNMNGQPQDDIHDEKLLESIFKLEEQGADTKRIQNILSSSKHQTASRDLLCLMLIRMWQPLIELSVILVKVFNSKKYQQFSTKIKQ